MNDPGLIEGTAIFALLLLLGVLLLHATRLHRHDLTLQLRLFLIAYALRFALSIAIYQFGLVAVLKDEDASGWVAGVALMESWIARGIGLADFLSELLGAFEGHHQGYYYMLGALFFVTGCPGRLSAAALNGFFGAMTVVFAYRTARVLFNAPVARRVGWWTALFPSMLIWSAMTVKEPVVIFLEVVAVYGCVRMRFAGLSFLHLALCALTIVLLVPFRFYAAYLVGLAVLLTLVAPTIFQPRSAIAGVLLLVVTLSLMAGTGALAQYEAYSEQASLERVQFLRNEFATGSLGTGSGVKTADIRTPGGMVAGILVGGAHLLLAPFPWQLGTGSIRMLLTLPELLYWWWLFFVAVIPGMRYAIKRYLSRVVSVLLLMFGLGLLYSLLFGNVGLVFRQRAQLLPWLLMFAGVGMELRRLRSQSVAPAGQPSPSLRRAPIAAPGRLTPPAAPPPHG